MRERDYTPTPAQLRVLNALARGLNASDAYDDFTGPFDWRNLDRSITACRERGWIEQRDGNDWQLTDKGRSIYTVWHDVSAKRDRR